MQTPVHTPVRAALPRLETREVAHSFPENRKAEPSMQTTPRPSRRLPRPGGARDSGGTNPCVSHTHSGQPTRSGRPATRPGAPADGQKVWAPRDRECRRPGADREDCEPATLDPAEVSFRYRGRTKAFSEERQRAESLTSDPTPNASSALQDSSVLLRPEPSAPATPRGTAGNLRRHRPGTATLPVITDAALNNADACFRV